APVPLGPSISENIRELSAAHHDDPAWPHRRIVAAAARGARAQRDPELIRAETADERRRRMAETREAYRRDRAITPRQRVATVELWKAIYQLGDWLTPPDHAPAGSGRYQPDPALVDESLAEIDKLLPIIPRNHAVQQLDAIRIRALRQHETDEAILAAGVGTPPPGKDAAHLAQHREERMHTARNALLHNDGILKAVAMVRERIGGKAQRIRPELVLASTFVDSTDVPPADIIAKMIDQRERAIVYDTGNQPRRNKANAALQRELGQLLALRSMRRSLDASGGDPFVLFDDMAEDADMAGHALELRDSPQMRARVQNQPPLRRELNRTGFADVPLDSLRVYEQTLRAALASAVLEDREPAREGEAAGQTIADAPTVPPEYLTDNPSLVRFIDREGRWIGGTDRYFEHERVARAILPDAPDSYGRGRRPLGIAPLYALTQDYGWVRYLQTSARGPLVDAYRPLTEAQVRALGRLTRESPVPGLTYDLHPTPTQYVSGTVETFGEFVDVLRREHMAPANTASPQTASPVEYDEDGMIALLDEPEPPTGKPRQRRAAAEAAATAPESEPVHLRAIAVAEAAANDPAVPADRRVAVFERELVAALDPEASPLDSARRLMDDARADRDRIQLAYVRAPSRESRVAVEDATARYEDAARAYD
ncbi:MAG: hypothetical protein KGK07_16930, partial [Chloroflexota bacterium]|nr:hypothetical protein [Chloroflexota bacterium]